MTEITSFDTFEDEILSSGLVCCVVYFYTSWAESSIELDAVLNELLQQNSTSRIRHFLCDANKWNNIALVVGIKSVPCVVFFLLGKEIEHVEGADIVMLRWAYNSFLTRAALQEEAARDSMQQRISSHQVVLYVEGSAASQKCGCSRQMIQLLQSAGIPFSMVDVLQDEATRHLLKEEHGPMFPLLFVRGQLTSGSEGLVKMIAEGQLADIV